jgi:hypothetical protein
VRREMEFLEGAREEINSYKMRIICGIVFEAQNKNNGKLFKLLRLL